MKRRTTHTLLSVCFGLLAAPGWSQLAKVQLIQNCADQMVMQMDVYLNGELLLDDFMFRTATPFISLPAGSPCVLGIAPRGSESAADVLVSFPFELQDHANYIIVANGIISTEGYSEQQPFDLTLIPDARIAAQTSGNTDLIFLHGSADAPSVDVYENGIFSVALFTELAYGGTSGYHERPTGDRDLEVIRSGGNRIGLYDAPFASLGLADSAATVLLSGFRSPEDNSNGPAMGLWMALPAGGDLIELESADNVGIAERYLTDMTVWPNPTAEVLHLTGRESTSGAVDIMVLDLAGRRMLETRRSGLFGQQDPVRIDVGTLPNGSYLLHVSNATLRQTIPFQVIR